MHRGQQLPLGPTIALALAATLAAVTAAAPEANHQYIAPATSLSFSVRAGFSSWANPLPNYPLVLPGRTDDAGMYYNDLAVTPLRIRVTNPGRVNVPFEVRVWNHATPLAASALLAALEMADRGAAAERNQDSSSPESSEPQRDTPLQGAGASAVERLKPSLARGAFTAPTIFRKEELIARKQRTQDFFIPVTVFPLQPGRHPVGLRIEFCVQDQPVSEAFALVRFLPAGGVYSALIARQANRQILRDEVKPNPPPETAWLPPNFYFDHGIVTVPYSMLGPNHTVLRHFQYIIISAELMRSLPARPRQLLTDAAALGSRLVVCGADSEVEVAGELHRADGELVWHKAGFGQVAVCSLDLLSLREALVEELEERAVESYRYFTRSQLDATDPTWERSLMMSQLLGEAGAPSYGWVFTGGSGLLEVNPVWAYDYVFSPALAQPLELPILHWENLWTRDVFAEKNQSGVGRRMVAFPVALQKAFMGDSLSSLSAFILYFCLVLLAATGTCLWWRRSYLLVVLIALAICGFASFAFLLQRARTAPGVTDCTELSFLKGSASASVVERELLLGFFQAGSEPVDFALPLRDLAVKRIAPIRQDMLTVSSEQGMLAGLTQFNVNPFLVSEVVLRGVTSRPPLFNLNLQKDENGPWKLRLGNATGSELRFVLLALHGDLLDLGPMAPGQEITLLLPPHDHERPEGTDESSSNRVRATRETLQSFLNATLGSDYRAFGRGTAQSKIQHALDRAALAVLPYELVADRERIYVLALRNDSMGMALRGVRRPPAGASELILYNLQ